MQSYFEVEFPDTKLQVSAEFTEGQAREAMIRSITDFITKNIRLIEPESEPEPLPDDIEVSFGNAAVSQSVEETG